MSQRQGPWLLQFWADGTGTLLVLEGNYIEKEEIDLNSVVLGFVCLFVCFVCFLLLFFFFFFFFLWGGGGGVFFFIFIYLFIYLFIFCSRKQTLTCQSLFSGKKKKSVAKCRLLILYAACRALRTLREIYEL